jgi:hypothetical protein
MPGLEPVPPRHVPKWCTLTLRRARFHLTPRIGVTCPTVAGTGSRLRWIWMNVPLSKAMALLHQDET